MSTANDSMWTSTTNLEDSLFTNDPAFGRYTGSGIYTSYSAGNHLLYLLLLRFFLSHHHEQRAGRRRWRE
jgi:hypothetical protein